MEPQDNYNRQFLFSAVAPIEQPKKVTAKKSPRVVAIGLVVALAALTGGAIGAGGSLLAYSNMENPAPILINNSESVNWVTGAAAAASPSVVTLSVISASGNSGSGSGVVLTEDGYVLTNSHVVTLGGNTNDVRVSVRTWQGEVIPATVIGTDPVNDLAVIKLDSIAQFTPITFADSTELNVGESVVAIGAPLGLSSTVTQGIVSALNRTIQVASSEVTENDSGTLEFWSGGSSVPPINLQVLQTDAAINPGNSGGALVNQNGELVGINVAIATSGGNTAGNIGVGFAIPSNTAKRIAAEIIDKGFASHGLLGALVSDSVGSGSGFSTGARVIELTPGGAADRAGLLPGDIVTRFGSTPIASSGDLTAAVRSLPAGDVVAIELERNGQKLRLEVVLGDSRDLESS